MELYCAVKSRGTGDLFGNRSIQHSGNTAQSPSWSNEEPVRQNRTESHGVEVGGVCPGLDLQGLDGDRGADGMNMDGMA